MDLRRSGPGSGARLQCAVLALGVYLLPPASSDISAAPSSLRPRLQLAARVLVLALLWQRVKAGTTVYSRRFPATIDNSKASSAGRVERVFVIVGSTKGPPCFHRLMSVVPCTCRSDIHGGEAAVVVEELSPEPVPTHSMLLLVSGIWFVSALGDSNASFHLKCVGKCKPCQADRHRP